MVDLIIIHKLIIIIITNNNNNIVDLEVGVREVITIDIIIVIIVIDQIAINITPIHIHIIVGAIIANLLHHLLIVVDLHIEGILMIIVKKGVGQDH